MKKFNSTKNFINYEPKKNDKRAEILVGMGSCGIAAGADKVFNLLEEEISKRGITTINLKKVGCLGLCFSEPNVEVKTLELPDILYGKVDEKFAIRILEEHIANNNIINENIYDKPYIDVLTLN